MTSGTRPPSCVPTWRGHIETTKDALLVFEACFQGILHHCSRRPHDRERNQLIISGNVFVYEEATSGIKRWTDGIPWSPSRILTNFLIYRQLNSPFPPGEKKRATKRNQRPSRPGEPYSTPTSQTNTPVQEEPKPLAPQSPDASSVRKEDDGSDKEINRGLVGSLVDSYEFKEGGLLKKTMTVTVRNVQHHLVSYYSLEDAKFSLKTPRDDPRLKDLQISDALIKQPKFKFPNLDDAGDGTFESMEGPAGQYGGYYPSAGAAGYATAHYPYQYSASVGYAHPGAYAPAHPPHQAYTTMPPTNPLYAQSAGHYAQHHPSYQQYYQAQVPNMPHYSSGYSQHYQGQQAPAQAAAVTPVKQEHPATSAPHYSYNGASQSQAVNDVYGTHPANGTSSAQDEETVVPATTQPPQAHTWPINSYSSAWAGRQEAPSYPSYRPPG